MASTPEAYDQLEQKALQRLWHSVARRVNWVSFNRLLWIIFRTVLIMGICYVILFPLLTKISGSFMTRTDLWDRTVAWIPRYGTLNNYRLVWEHMKYPQAFLNSLQLTLIVSMLQLLSCTVVGYGFARFPFRGRNFLFALVILTLVIPPQMVSIPLYLSFRFFDFWGLAPQAVNLLNSYWPFVLLSITGTGLRNGLFIYIMRQFFRGMPVDLEEAAYVDGAGPIRTFGTVMLPGAVPALVIVFLFAFVWQWNDYFLSSMFLPRLTILPMTLDGVAESVIGQYARAAPEEASLLNNTGSLLLIAPILITYLVLQRYFIESVQRTGLGGG